VTVSIAEGVQHRTFGGEDGMSRITVFVTGDEQLALPDADRSIARCHGFVVAET
jgi:hypothetical protein